MYIYIYIYILGLEDLTLLDGMCAPVFVVLPCIPAGTFLYSGRTGGRADGRTGGRPGGRPGGRAAGWQRLTNPVTVNSMKTSASSTVTD